MKSVLLSVLIITLLIFSWRLVHAAGTPPQPGENAPAFSLLDQSHQPHELKNYLGKWVVLYFYPKDDTPGCTKEACSFRDDLVQLEKLGAQVIGISVDDTELHSKFAAKYHLPFPLLSDQDGSVAERYGALNDFGIIKVAKRYTFLIDPQGRITKTYLSVDTSRHSQEIITDLKKQLKQ